MAEFDSVPKSLLSAHPQGFLAFLLGHANAEWIETLNPEQTTVKTQTMDSLLRVQLDGKEALVHCEFQTTDSTKTPMPLRMAGYMGRCIAEHGLPLLSYVLYLRPDAGRRDPGEYVQEVVGHEVVLRYKVIRLISLDGATYLSSGNVGVLPFTPLMGRPVGVGVEAWLRRCVATTEALEVPRAVKHSVLAHMGVLSSLVCEESTISSFISEGIMTEFPLLESLRKRTLEQGLKQGIEQGIEQGLEGLRQSIQETLAIRFSEDAARAVAARLAAIKQIEPLQTLLRAAIQVDQLADFTRLLDETTAE